MSKIRIARTEIRLFDSLLNFIYTIYKKERALEIYLYNELDVIKR